MFFLFVCVGCFFVKNVTANVKAYRLNKPFSALSVVFTPSCGQRVYSLRAAMILKPSPINTHKHMVYYVQTETANVCLMISSQWQVSTCCLAQISKPHQFLHVQHLNAKGEIF